MTGDGTVDDVTGQVEVWTCRVGVTLACQAFGVSPRTWRHRQQQSRGELPERRSRSTGAPRRAHPEQLDAPDREAVLRALCEPRSLMPELPRMPYSAAVSGTAFRGVQGGGRKVRRLRTRSAQHRRAGHVMSRVAVAWGGSLLARRYTC